MAKNAMTTKKENAVAEVIPFANFGSMGFDTIDTQDYATPRLKALMALSPVRSEEHTSNSSHITISYAVFCLKKKKKNQETQQKKTKKTKKH